LLKHKRGASYIRIGLEAQGDWFPWGAGNGDNTAEGYKAAFVHVATLLRAKLPESKIVFDTSCGAPLRGQSNRMDPLTALYPGDDVVDVVGCDHYDHYQLISHTEKQFTKALTPAKAAGLQDTLDFARAHGKKFAVPEWGLTSPDRNGGGDNEYFIYAMYRWFAANAKDIAFENYFNEPAAYLKSSIWDEVQNPRSSAEYKRLWGLTAKPGTASASG
jgi:beta-mannanase